MKGATLALAVALVSAAPARPLVAGAIDVGGPPSSLAAGAGGSIVYVGLDQHFGRGGGITAYRRSDGRLVRLGFAAVPNGTQGIALLPDGSAIVATTRVGIAAVATAPLIAGAQADATSVRDGDAPATSQIVAARDGRHVFYTSAATAVLGVAEVTPHDGAAPSLRVVGHVPLDRAPAGLALSPDGATVYVVSEVAKNSAGLAGAADPRIGRERCASNFGAQGTLSAVSAAAAVADPANAVTARVAAGCGPTRVVLSKDGSVAWVSVRGENRVLAFDARRLAGDAAKPLLADVAVGPIPVGLALDASGARLLVANSHRSRDPDVAGAADLSLIDVAAALHRSGGVVATIPTGALAREILALPDGSFAVTDYNADAVDVIPAHRLDRRTGPA